MGYSPICVRGPDGRCHTSPWAREIKVILELILLFWINVYLKDEEISLCPPVDPNFSIVLAEHKKITFYPQIFFENCPLCPFCWTLTGQAWRKHSKVFQKFWITSSLSPIQKMRKHSRVFQKLFHITLPFFWKPFHYSLQFFWKPFCFTLTNSDSISYNRSKFLKVLSLYLHLHTCKQFHFAIVYFLNLTKFGEGGKVKQFQKSRGRCQLLNSKESSEKVEYTQRSSLNNPYICLF